MKITDNLYHNLAYDWDAELNQLHGEDLWNTPNGNTRNVRNMVVKECEIMVNKVKKLSWWRRLFNKF